MKKLIFISVLLLLIGCAKPSDNSDGKLKTIEIGDYIFDFPSSFELIEEKGLDSYVGKVKGDSISFGFDFGYYSNSLQQTAQEYIEQGYWKDYASYQFMKEGVVYDNSNTPKVEILNIRPASLSDSTIGKGCDFIAKCKHKNKEFDFPIYIPTEIKYSKFIIDTVDNQYRKIVYTQSPLKKTAGIYIRDIKGFNKSINNYLALSMFTSNLTQEQQEIAIKILLTGRRRKGNK